MNWEFDKSFTHLLIIIITSQWFVWGASWDIWQVIPRHFDSCSWAPMNHKQSHKFYLQVGKPDRTSDRLSERRTGRKVWLVLCCWQFLQMYLSEFFAGTDVCIVLQSQGFVSRADIGRAICKLKPLDRRLHSQIQLFSESDWKCLMYPPLPIGFNTIKMNFESNWER